jgi:hypothetical protein
MMAQWVVSYFNNFKNLLGGAREILKVNVDSFLSCIQLEHGSLALRASRAASTTLMGIARPLNQPWSSEFDTKIMQIVEGGMVDHFLSKYIPPKKYSLVSKEGDEIEAYRVEHILGPLAMLAAGLVMSSVVAGLEHLWARFKNPSFLL